MSSHGTFSAYVRGCRCDDCRQANTEYRRTYVIRRREAWLRGENIRPPRQHTPKPEPQTQIIGDWAHDASCRGQRDWVMSAITIRNRRAHALPEVRRVIRICTDCPALEQCTRWVMAHDEDPCPWHVVAGMTPRQRNDIRKHQRGAA